MVMAKRSHLFPSRTQKLSSAAPMILGGKLPGKVGRCQFELTEYCVKNFFKKLLTQRKVSVNIINVRYGGQLRKKNLENFIVWKFSQNTK